MVKESAGGFIAQATGTWFRMLGGPGATFHTGTSGSWAASWEITSSDFNGDGLTDFLLYDPATGAYQVAVKNGGGYTYSSGMWSLGWTPLVGDLNGNGADDVFLYSAATGQWFEMISSHAGNAITFTVGGNDTWSTGWDIQPTDFNGDGRTDFLLYHPPSGVWYQARNLTLGTFTYSTGTWAPNLTIVARQSGLSGGLPSAPAPAQLPAPAPTMAAYFEAFHAEAGPFRTEAGSFGPGVHALEESPDGASPSFVEYEAPSWPPPVDVTLTLDIAGTGSGTVTSSPSGLATCTGAAQTCVGTFALGTVVTLTATAAEGHQFTGWGGPCKGTAPCLVMMADARYVAAHFRQVPTVKTSFYHVDTLGSVRAVTNSVGDVIRRDDYHAFGEAGTTPVGDPIRFTGKERDAETALDYFGARYYRNLAGRFTSVDPLMGVETALADPQRWNRYSYVGNRPTRVVDPDGRSWWSTAIKVVIKGGDIAASVSGIVDDYKTITDDKSSVGEKILAGLSIASEALPISAGDVKSVASFAMRHGDEAVGGSRVAEAAKAIRDWLGDGARIIKNKDGDMVIINRGETRRVRFDINNPYPHQEPHGHAEEFIAGKWRKSGPVYPEGK